MVKSPLKKPLRGYRNDVSTLHSAGAYPQPAPTLWLMATAVPHMAGGSGTWACALAAFTYLRRSPLAQWVGQAVVARWPGTIFITLRTAWT